MPDLAAWARELREAAQALEKIADSNECRVCGFLGWCSLHDRGERPLGAALILADHLLTNVQLKIRALRAAQLLEAAQARKTVLPAAEPPKRRGGVRVVNNNKRASARHSVIDQLCEED